MSAWLLAFAAAFGAVFLLELPDKTTALTLVLTTRFRAATVLTGAAVAFALQSVIAVSFARLLTLLPERAVAAAVAVLFGAGAIMLLREAARPTETDPADQAGVPRRGATFTRAALTSAGVLFAAEWADASQLAAVGVAARYAQPVAVAIGTFLALMSVTALALLVGRKLTGRVRPRLIKKVAGFVFAGFAVAAAWSALAG